MTSDNPFDLEVAPPRIVRPAGLPADGFHDDVAFEVYHAWDAASHSRLEDCRRSLAYCRWRLDNPDEDEADVPWTRSPAKGATLVGDAAHCAILEPDALTTRYARRPDDIDLATKGGKEEFLGFARGLGFTGATYGELAPGPSSPVILHPETYDLALAIRDSVWVREWGEKARKILRAASAREQSALATDDETGCPMKARVDVVADRLGTLADVKTSRDAHRERFSRAIHTFGIDRQLAHYMRVYAALGRRFRHGVVIAVENTPPHEVAVRRIDSASISASFIENDEMLKAYAEAVRTGRWTGYEDDPPTVGRPEWALPRDGEGEF